MEKFLLFVLHHPSPLNTLPLHMWHVFGSSFPSMVSVASLVIIFEYVYNYYYYSSLYLAKRSYPSIVIYYFEVITLRVERRELETIALISDLASMSLVLHCILIFISNERWAHLRNSARS